MPTRQNPPRNPLACAPPIPGDTVVHLDFGLCRMGGLRRLELSDGVVETVELRFRGKDTRHVPVADAVRLWNYGAHLPGKKLDRMGADDWAARQGERVAELRASLAALRDRKDARMARKGYDIAVEDASLDKAGGGFPHDLTECQTKALGEVIGDLRAPQPMNRLLVGDVGCGKTEVAVRAALAAALAGTRVRLVAPTRVLARQHHEDVAERAEALGLFVQLYSGDLTNAERREAETSNADIFIGTHGLLGARFAEVDFGLTVIDEEQKFGAKIKRAGFCADAGSNCLRLSATPIPGTVAEARVGLADLSLIEGYPTGRGVTETRSEALSDAALKAACEAEFARGGQVIVLAPRIKDIGRLKPLMRRLFPERRFGVVHAKRKSKANRKTLRKLRDGALDGVLATTVLETGVNLPQANTLLVVRPERFGLAQLHQLRGRVGRGERDAHFVLLSGKVESESFAKRRRVLETLDARGDGLALALADAMLRGTGGMTGAEQTGHASAVGLELYEYLLGQDMDDPFAHLPKIGGQTDWGLPEDPDAALVTAIAESRGALSGAPGDTALAALIAACRARGADRASVGPKGVVLQKGEAEVLRADSLAEVLAD